MNKEALPVCRPVISFNENAQVRSGQNCHGDQRLIVRTDTPERNEKVFRAIRKQGKSGVKFGKLVSLVNSRQKNKYAVADIAYSVERLEQNGNVSRNRETGILVVTDSQWHKVSGK